MHETVDSVSDDQCDELTLTFEQKFLIADGELERLQKLHKRAKEQMQRQVKKIGERESFSIMIINDSNNITSLIIILII